MGKYLTTFEKAFENADFIDLTYQAFGIFIALIVLFIIGLAIKSFVNTRIRKIGQFSMDFNDLKKMRRTGLVSEVEYEKIKSGLISRFIKDTGEDKEIRGKTDRKIPEPSLSNRREIKTGMPPVSSPLPSPKPSSHKKPVDIDDLLKRGIITPEEYQKLSEISHKKTDK